MEYITKADFRRQKTALTKAINSKDPFRVLETVEKTLGEWQGKCWPDDWARWSVALWDAWYQYERSAEWGLPMPETVSRFQAAYDRFG
jgi:hypothetical protein